MYTIDEENNKAIIYNYAPYPTGEAGYIEFYYSTNKTTLYYTDMGGSTKVHAKMYATNDNSTVTAEAEAKEVYIDTHATISYTQKKMPYLYKTWNSSWGDKPADADDYLYSSAISYSACLNTCSSGHGFSANAAIHHQDIDDEFTEVLRKRDAVTCLGSILLERLRTILRTTKKDENKILTAIDSKCTNFREFTKELDR